MFSNEEPEMVKELERKWEERCKSFEKSPICYMEQSTGKEEEDAFELTDISSTTAYTENTQEQKNMEEVPVAPNKDETSQFIYGLSSQNKSSSFKKDAGAAKILKAELIKSLEINVQESGSGFTKDDISTAYVGTSILLAGENAATVLESTWNEIKEECPDAPTMITLNGETVSSLSGRALQIFVKSALFDTNKTFPVFLLVLENFKQEQIIDICHRDFVKETLHGQPSLANIIFVLPFIENLEIFSTNLDTIILTSNFSKNQNDIKSSISSSTSTKIAERPTLNTLAVEKKVAPTMLVVKPQPVSINLPDEMNMPIVEVNSSSRRVEKSLQEIKAKEYDFPHHGTTLYDFKTALQAHEYVELPDPAPKSEKVEDKNESCIRRVFNCICTVLTQCGDCCFY